MYKLVADISSYPEFLKWCSGAEIIEDSETETVASLTIDFKAVEQKFTTRNRKTPGRKIEMSLVEGPFNELFGTWQFTPLEENACKIELHMEFGFDSSAVEKLIAPVFSSIANRQVEAFCDRARNVYGD